MSQSVFRRPQRAGYPMFESEVRAIALWHFVSGLCIAMIVPSSSALVLMPPNEYRPAVFLLAVAWTVAGVLAFVYAGSIFRNVKRETTFEDREP